MRICLVSGSHISSNPRLVKEADALHAAGYEVEVVAGRNYAPNDALDASILQAAPWRATIVDYSSGLRAGGQRVLRQLARRFLQRSDRLPLSFIARAHHPAAIQLGRVAARIPADLFIGHTLVGLAAAAHAAGRQNTRLGFDAEDFHALETESASAEPVEACAIRILEQTLLPRCHHLTAAAPLIGEAYAARYRVNLPATVLNVFPLREAPASPVATTPAFSREHPARLYWVSQTIGPGRGLEPLLAILKQVQTPVLLSLRGTIAPSYERELRAAVTAAGDHVRLEILLPAPPAEMARLAATHDLGLAIELPQPENRNICLTNKIFTYLLAGIPVAYTPTRAQLQIAAALGPAALLVDLNDPVASARRLDAFFQNQSQRESARHEAWRLGQERYNWDVEQQLFLKTVAAALQ